MPLAGGMILKHIQSEWPRVAFLLLSLLFWGCLAHGAEALKEITMLSSSRSGGELG